MTSWPFTPAELTAGLRRYFADPGLRVLALHDHPLVMSDDISGVTQVRGLRVEYQSAGHTLNLACVVKQPHGVSQAGLAGAGLREVGVYQALGPQLPMPIPALVAADAKGDWLVLEAVGVEIAPPHWRAEHYTQALRSLVDLHERFWNLGDDLTAYRWLAQPLALDFEVHVYAAAQALARLVAENWPGVITNSDETLRVLGLAISQAERVAAPLRALPPTLLHGNLWPGSVALQADGEMVVFDWRLAGIGPGLLDLAGFVLNSQWWLGALPLPPADLIALYRAELARRMNVRWDDDEWADLWDYAVLWRFLQETLPWLSHAPRAVFEAHGVRAFEVGWLSPVLAAARRHLLPALPFSFWDLNHAAHR